MLGFWMWWVPYWEQTACMPLEMGRQVNIVSGDVVWWCEDTNVSPTTGALRGL